MTQTLCVVKHVEHGLTKVLTTTYKSGLVSKRYLDAQTGLPFHVEWIKPKSQFPWDDDADEDTNFGGVLVTNPVKPRVI